PRWRPPLVRVARGSARWRPVASYPGRPSAYRRFGPRDLRVHPPTALDSRCSLVGASHQRRPRHGVLGGSLGCTPQRLVEQLRFAADLGDELDHNLTTSRFSQRHHHSTTNERGNGLRLATTSLHSLRLRCWPPEIGGGAAWYGVVHRVRLSRGLHARECT